MQDNLLQDNDPYNHAHTNKYKCQPYISHFLDIFYSENSP